jgi:hypothetical protein
MSPVHLEIPIDSFPSIANHERPKMIVRAPLLVQQILLKPGKIETTVIADSDELDAGGIWITSVPKLPSVPSSK